MPHWLRCKVLPGQFSNEFVVKGQSANGEGFSLFCPEEFVEFEGEPSFAHPAAGWIQVQVVETAKGVRLVCLPRDAFGGGPYVTVKADEVERRPVRQKAQFA